MDKNLLDKFQFVKVLRTAPKPPSDEGGGSKSRRERILPLSQPARLTAPLTRGALGAAAPIGKFEFVEVICYGSLRCEQS